MRKLVGTIPSSKIQKPNYASVLHARQEFLHRHPYFRKNKLLLQVDRSLLLQVDRTAMTALLCPLSPSRPHSHNLLLLRKNSHNHQQQLSLCLPSHFLQKWRMVLGCRGRMIAATWLAIFIVQRTLCIFEERSLPCKSWANHRMK
jgi:hypothetical protein